MCECDQIKLGQILNRLNFDKNKQNLEIEQTRKELETVVGKNVAYTTLDPEINNGRNVITYLNSELFKSNDLIESYNRVVNKTQSSLPINSFTFNGTLTSSGLFIINQGDYKTMNSKFVLNQAYQLQGYGFNKTSVTTEGIVAKNLNNFMISDMALKSSSRNVNDPFIEVSGTVSMFGVQIVDSTNNLNINSRDTMPIETKSIVFGSKKENSTAIIDKMVIRNSSFNLTTNQIQNIPHVGLKLSSVAEAKLVLSDNYIIVNKNDINNIKLLSIGSPEFDQGQHAGWDVLFSQNRVDYNINKGIGENTIISNDSLKPLTVNIDMPNSAIFFNGFGGNITSTIIKYENSKNLTNVNISNTNITNRTTGTIFLIDNPVNEIAKTSFKSLTIDRGVGFIEEYKNVSTIKGVNSVSSFNEIAQSRLTSISNGSTRDGGSLFVDNQIVAKQGKIGNIEFLDASTFISGPLLTEQLTAPFIISNDIFIERSPQASLGMINSHMMNVRENASFAGGISNKYVTINGDYTIKNTDYYVLINIPSLSIGRYTINMPKLNDVQDGQTYYITRPDSNSNVTTILITDKTFLEFNASTVELISNNIIVYADKIRDGWAVISSNIFYIFQPQSNNRLTSQTKI